MEINVEESKVKITQNDACVLQNQVRQNKLKEHILHILVSILSLESSS